MKKSIVNRIKKMIRQKGETQEEFAKAIGFKNRQSIIRRFNGQTCTSEKDIKAICKHLRVSKEELGF